MTKDAILEQRRELDWKMRELDANAAYWAGIERQRRHARVFALVATVGLAVTLVAGAFVK